MVQTVLRWPTALVASLILSLLLPVSAARARQADAATWGVYARMLDGQWTSVDAEVAYSFSWSEPGEEIVQRAPVGGERFITRGGKPGELLYREAWVGGARYIGHVQPDGSVVFESDTRLFKSGFRVLPTEDGGWQQEWLKFRKDEFTVREAYTRRYRLAGGAAPMAPAIAETATLSDSTVPASRVASADAAAHAPGPERKPQPAKPASVPSAWGVLADMLDRTWPDGEQTTHVSWSVPGEEMRVVARDNRDTNVVYELQVRLARKSGRLEGKVISARDAAYGDFMAASYGGKVDGDGSVRLDQRKLLGAAFFYFKRGPGGSIVIDNWYRSLHTPVFATDMAIPPARSAWGLYLDLVGQAWLDRDPKGDGVEVFNRYGWLVPGRSLWVRRDAPANNYGAFNVIWLSPGTDELNYATTDRARVDTRVSSDGSVLHEGRGFSGGLRGTWGLRRDASGQIVFAGDGGALSAKFEAVQEPISQGRVQAIFASAQQAEQERERRKQEAREERSALFGAALQGLAQGTAQGVDDYQNARAQQDALLAQTTMQATQIAREVEQQRQVARNESDPALASVRSEDAAAGSAVPESGIPDSGQGEPVNCRVAHPLETLLSSFTNSEGEARAQVQQKLGQACGQKGPPQQKGEIACSSQRRSLATSANELADDARLWSCSVQITCAQLEIRQCDGPRGASAQ